MAADVLTRQELSRLVLPSALLNQHVVVRSSEIVGRGEYDKDRRRSSNGMKPYIRPTK